MRPGTLRGMRVGVCAVRGGGLRQALLLIRFWVLWTKVDRNRLLMVAVPFQQFELFHFDARTATENGFDTILVLS